MIGRRGLWVVGLWLLASTASAQVKQGQLRLWLDSALVNYDRVHLIEGGKWRTEHDVRVGPQALSDQGTLPGPFGYGIGWAAHPHFVPQLALSFGVRATSTTRSNGLGGTYPEAGPSAFGLMAAPRFEVPFNPEGRAVFGALAGFDFRMRRARYNLPDETHVKTYDFGFGPSLGLTSHFFVARGISLDVSVLGQLDFVRTWTENDVLPRYRDHNVFTLGLLVGTSFWL